MGEGDKTGHQETGVKWPATSAKASELPVARSSGDEYSELLEHRRGSEWGRGQAVEEDPATVAFEMGFLVHPPCSLDTLLVPGLPGAHR